MIMYADTDTEVIKTVPGAVVFEPNETRRRLIDTLNILAGTLFELTKFNLFYEKPV